jgi:hypothetical protein
MRIKIMKMLKVFTVFLFTVLVARVAGQEDPLSRGLNSISAEVIKAQMNFLASDWTEGRELGTKGEYLSGDYIANMLMLNGLKPGGDYEGGSQGSRTYFQNFRLIKTLPGENQSLYIRYSTLETEKITELNYNVDFIVRSAGHTTRLTAPVVFAGYGFMSDKLKYNDLEKTDIKGKFLLKVAGLPEFARKALSSEEMNAATRNLETFARENGAVGIIEFDPSSLVTGNPSNLDFLNTSVSEGRPSTGRPYARYSIPSARMPDDFIRLEVSARAANKILEGSQVNLGDYLAKAGKALPYVKSTLTGISLTVSTSARTEQVNVRNVLGVIEGNNPNEVIVVGAHYDHMGAGNGYIWNGADDNASGTVAVMTLARAMAASGRKPEKTIIFALWTAEESGLLGSRYYVRNPGFPIQNIKLNINFDMVSRYISDDKQDAVTMTYTRAYPKFREIVENSLKKHNIGLSVDYQPSDDPPGGSDHRSFVEMKIPVLRFKPGHREEYHTPYDELDTIDWDIMLKIIKINYLALWELANSQW